jgi:hypothetical protein
MVVSSAGLGPERDSKLQTRPLVTEGAPQRQHSACPTVTKDRPTDHLWQSNLDLWIGGTRPTPLHHHWDDMTKLRSVVASQQRNWAPTRPTWLSLDNSACTRDPSSGLDSEGVIHKRPRATHNYARQHLKRYSIAWQLQALPDIRPSLAACFNSVQSEVTQQATTAGGSIQVVTQINDTVYRLIRFEGTEFVSMSTKGNFVPQGPWSIAHVVIAYTGVASFAGSSPRFRFFC